VPEILVVFGSFLALAGGVALLAGLSGLRRVRRLRRAGLMTWALPVTEPPAAEAAASGRPAESASPVLLRYALADGQVMERIAPAPARRAALRPGQKVLIWYDPADPDDVLVYGRWGRATDRAFVAGGLLTILIGLTLAALPH
jgi:hypothetical protein